MITVPDIVAAVADAAGLALADLVGPSRRWALVRPRHLAMLMAKRLTEASLADIGRALGGRAPASVLYGIDNAEVWLADSEEARLMRDLALALAAGQTGAPERAALAQHRAVARDEAEITAGLEREEIRLARAAALQQRAAGKGVL
jgi:hypothetical protein